jgi:hypothetical protein
MGDRLPSAGSSMPRVVSVLLSITLLTSSRIALADEWPASKRNLYFTNCVKVHTELWKGIPEATLIRVCNCKLGALLTSDYPPKTLSFEALEKWAALPEKQRVELFDQANDKEKTAMFLVARAEEKCAPK